MDEDLSPEEHDTTAAAAVFAMDAQDWIAGSMVPPLAVPDEPAQPARDARVVDRQSQARLAYRLQHVRTVRRRQLMEEWWEQERRVQARLAYPRRERANSLAPPRPQILVVSQVAATRDELTVVLAREGYAVSIAGSRDEALRAIAHTRPALIIWELPVTLMDNNGLVEAMRERGIAVPVLLVTASTSGKVWAKHLGAAGHLCTPLECGALRMTVAELMSGAK